MSVNGGYSDAELLASAREYARAGLALVRDDAFNGLLNITVLSEAQRELKHSLRDHFQAILAAIDAEMGKMT